MFQEIITALFAFFILDPIEAEVDRAITAADAPMEVVETARDCVSDAGPAIRSRIGEDFWWSITQVTYVAVGMTQAEDVLVEVVPSCAPALNRLNRTEAEDQA